MTKKVILFLIILGIFLLGIYFFLQKEKLSKKTFTNENIQKTKPLNYSLENEPAQQIPFISNPLKDFLSTQSLKKIAWFSPKNMETHEVISIKDFFQENSLFLPAEMEVMVDWKDYDIFLCPSQDENITGIRLNQMGNPQTGKPTRDEVLAFLDIWAKSMPSDLWLLFSKNPQDAKKIKLVNIENKEYSYDPTYEWEYKKAKVTFFDGEEKEFYYGMVAYNIIITSSLSCSHEASKQLYDLVP